MLNYLFLQLPAEHVIQKAGRVSSVPRESPNNPSARSEVEEDAERDSFSVQCDRWLEDDEEELQMKRAVGGHSLLYGISCLCGQRLWRLPSCGKQ